MGSIDEREDGARFGTLAELAAFCEKHPEFRPIEFGVRFARAWTTQERIDEHKRYLEIALEMMQMWTDRLPFQRADLSRLQQEIPTTERAIESTKASVDRIRKAIKRLESPND